MTHPTPLNPPAADAKNRALRTVAQNLLFDVLLAVVVVLLPVFNVGELDATDWGLVGASLVKTVAVTVLAGVHRYLETHRASRV